MTSMTFMTRVNSKRKEFAPSGSKFFPFRADPFSEGAKKKKKKKKKNDRVMSLERVSIFLKLSMLNS